LTYSEPPFLAREALKQSYMIIAIVKAAARVLKIVRTTVDVAKDCVELNRNICMTCWLVLPLLMLGAMLSTGIWGPRATFVDGIPAIVGRQDQIEGKLAIEIWTLLLPENVL
jgi:hypothetical protein